MDLTSECDWRGRNFRQHGKPLSDPQKAIGPGEMSLSLPLLELVRASIQIFAYKRQVAHQHRKQRYSFHIFFIDNHSLWKRKSAPQKPS